MKLPERGIERAIEKLPAPHPSGKQIIYWAPDLKGFGVLCSGKTNTKTYIAQRRLPNGRTRRVTVEQTNRITFDDARTKAEKLLVGIGEGNDPKSRGNKTTLRQGLKQYLDARHDLRERSSFGYRSAVERHLASWLDLPLSSITSDMIEARHREIKRSLERHYDEDTAPDIKITGAATANGVMRAFRAIYNFVADDVPDMPANPVRKLKRQWFPVPPRERVVRNDELPAFYAAIDALPSRTHRDYLMLLLFTGLRRNEAASLRWTDIDFADKAIHVPAYRTKADRKLDLPMTDVVRDLLVARRAIGFEGEYVFPAATKTGFLAEPKFPLTEVALTCGIRVSAHDLRRTYITVAEAADISPLALKALVNHSLPKNDVTAGYVRMTVARLREPAQRCADKLKELCAVPKIEDMKIAVIN